MVEDTHIAELQLAHEKAEMPDVGVARLRAIVTNLDTQGVLKAHEENEKHFANYSERRWFKFLGNKYEFQFATNQENPADTVEFATHHDQQGNPTAWETRSVLARLWHVTDTAEGPITTCYKLLRDPSGNESWISQTSSESKTEDGVRTWNLSKDRTHLDDVAARQLLFMINGQGQFKAQSKK